MKSTSSLLAYKSINQILTKRFDQSLIVLDAENMLDEEGNPITLTSFEDPEKIGNEIFTVSNKNSGERIDFIGMDWNQGTIELTSVQDDEMEIHSLSDPEVEIEQGDVFLQISIGSSNDQQQLVTNVRFRGFG
jgi:hypothetical protein